MKVGACYVLFNEEDYIKESLDSIYDWADEIYILLGHPFDENAKIKPDKTKEIVTNYEDVKNKISIYESDERDESACKNALLEKCRQSGMEYCWIVDGDEVYDIRSLPLLFGALRIRRPETVNMFSLEYFRSIHHAVGVESHLVMIKVTDDLNLRIRNADRTTQCLTLDEIYGTFHHYGLAKSPKRIREKYTSTKIRERKDHPFDLDEWMDKKFLAWKDNKEIDNLYPFRDDVWGKTFKVEDENIPHIMKKHKWYGVDCIE